MPNNKQYYPYNLKEFKEELCKHDGFITPKDSIDYYGEKCISIQKDGVLMGLLGFFTYKVLCNNFIWSDDKTPCGKEVM